MAKKPVSTKTRLRSAIRKVWLYSDLRRQVLHRCKVARNQYRCEKPDCGKIVTSKEIEVDHIVPATPPTGLETQEDWGYFIWNLLFISIDRLMALCTECHAEKTTLDREDKKQAKLLKKANEKR